jgi:glycosyltransferase involved in cell wall biosynthesis
VKKILFITYEYPTYTPFGGIAFYYQKTAKILKNLGINVCIYAAKVSEQKQNEDSDELTIVYIPCDGLNEFHDLAYQKLIKDSAFFDIIEVPHYGAPFLKQLKNGDIRNHCDLFTVRVHGSTLLSGITNNLVYFKYYKLLKYLGNNFFVNPITLRFIKKLNPPLYRVFKSHYQQSRLISLADLVNTTSGLMNKYIKENKITKKTDPKVFDNPSQFELIENFSINERLRILYVNRLQYWKGVDLFVEAVSRRQFVDLIDVEIYGEDCVGISTLVKSDEINKLNYKGKVNQTTLQKAMLEADIVVIPSRFESYSNVAIEAMSNSCIIILSDNVGFVNNIQEGVNGFVFKNGKLDSLIDAINRVINLNENLLINIKKNAFNTAKILSENKDLRNYYLNLVNF